jgi:hypothetical protein
MRCFPTLLTLLFLLIATCAGYPRWTLHGQEIDALDKRTDASSPSALELSDQESGASDDEDEQFDDESDFYSDEDDPPVELPPPIPTRMEMQKHTDASLLFMFERATPYIPRELAEMIGEFKNLYKFEAKLQKQFSAAFQSNDNNEVHALIRFYKPLSEPLQRHLRKLAVAEYPRAKGIKAPLPQPDTTALGVADQQLYQRFRAAIQSRDSELVEQLIQTYQPISVVLQSVLLRVARAAEKEAPEMFYEANLIIVALVQMEITRPQRSPMQVTGTITEAMIKMYEDMFELAQRRIYSPDAYRDYNSNSFSMQEIFLSDVLDLYDTQMTQAWAPSDPYFELQIVEDLRRRSGAETLAERGQDLLQFYKSIESGRYKYA